MREDVVVPHPPESGPRCKGVSGINHSNVSKTIKQCKHDKDTFFHYYSLSPVIYLLFLNFGIK